jgi:hypothetical protein
MSVSADVLTATVATVTALALAPTPTIRTRKRAAALDGEQAAYPLVVVSAGDGEQVEQICTRAGRRRFLVRYPVSVAVVFKSQGKTAGNDTLRTWQESIRAALLDWMTGLRARGLPRVNNVEAAGKSVFDPQAFAGQGIDWGEETFTVETVE